MRIEQLIAFDKVVQHSSFTKAANELYKIGRASCRERV